MLLIWIFNSHSFGDFEELFFGCAFNLEPIARDARKFLSETRRATGVDHHFTKQFFSLFHRSLFYEFFPDFLFFVFTHIEYKIKGSVRKNASFQSVR